MDDKETPATGRIGWIDLTVENAEHVRDFYKNVVGWTHSEVEMGGYSDYCMNLNETAVAGVCHARGANADLPPVWIVYINVEDLDDSLEQVERLGGKRRGPVRNTPGHGRYCVIEDPAGAVAALFQPEG